MSEHKKYANFDSLSTNEKVGLRISKMDHIQCSSNASRIAEVSTIELCESKQFSQIPEPYLAYVIHEQFLIF